MLTFAEFSTVVPHKKETFFHLIDQYGKIFITTLNIIFHLLYYQKTTDKLSTPHLTQQYQRKMYQLDSATQCDTCRHSISLHLNRKRVYELAALTDENGSIDVCS